jgi:hypothetical protein
MAMRLLALRAGRPLPQEDSWYSFLLEAELTSVWLEGLGQLKNSMTSGIEPAIVTGLATAYYKKIFYKYAYGNTV